VHSIVRLRFGEQDVELPRLSGPMTLPGLDQAHLGAVVHLDHPLTPLLPYNGGIAFTGTGTTATSLSGMSQTSGNIPVFVDSKGSIIDLVALGSLSRQAFSDALKAVGGHMIGRNAFRQPGWHNLDMRVTKNFDFAHGANKYQVQLIGEAFNLLNTINPFVSSTRQDRFRATYNQSTNIYTFAALPDFGVPNSYATVPDPRQAQLAVKFIF